MMTQPDIAYSVNKLSQFLSQPQTTHFQTAKRILRYLKGTYRLSLHLKSFKSLQLHIYTDADWATDIDDRKFVAGLCTYLGGTLVSWSSRKQRVVARSSTESEYRALADGVAEVKWIDSLLFELGLFLKRPSVAWCDNVSARALAGNPVHHARSKHIEIDVHFIRDMVLSGLIDVRYTPTAHQVADSLTKPLPWSQFQHFRSKLGLVVTPSRLRGRVRE